jgi:hypothetical protein
MEESIPHATALDVGDFFLKSQRRLTIDDIDELEILSQQMHGWYLGRRLLSCSSTSERHQ